MLMRGGSSKGAYFLAEDLPTDVGIRDDLILRIMGSPDIRQIDGIGGGHPLTSKVAIVSESKHDDADVDYQFLQVDPGTRLVTDRQTCGNLLAGVAPFALERQLVPTNVGSTAVRIRSVNPTESFATATVQTPDGNVTYDGDELMAGTLFPAASIPLEFYGSGSSLFPTAHTREHITGLPATCIDAGMPSVLISAADLGLTGYESPAELEDDQALRQRIELLRLQAGSRMGLGDVHNTTVPKVCIISPPRFGGTISTRTFIPHRVHTAIGVHGAVSVAAAVLAEDTIASQYRVPDERIEIEHPSGELKVAIALNGHGRDTALFSSTIVRTARKLMDGTVWPRIERTTK